MPMAEARYPESMFRLRTNSPALANLGMRSTVDTALEILHSCLSGCSGDFCLRLLERKEEFEAGAGMPAVCRGIEVQSTAVPGDDFCTDREPETRPVASFGRKERFQNLCLNFCWNS